MAKNPKPLRRARRQIKRALHDMDPTWSGKKPRLRRPIQLRDAQGRPVLIDARRLYERRPGSPEAILQGCRCRKAP